MLDKESTIREDLLDWFMHNESESSQLLSKLEEKSNHFLKPKARTSQRIFLIEQLLEIQVQKKLYLLVIFDECTIALYDAVTYASVLEYVIPQDTLHEPLSSQQQTSVKSSKDEEQKTSKDGDSSIDINNIAVNTPIKIRSLIGSATGINRRRASTNLQEQQQSLKPWKSPISENKLLDSVAETKSRGSNKSTNNKNMNNVSGYSIEQPDNSPVNRNQLYSSPQSTIRGQMSVTRRSLINKDNNSLVQDQQSPRDNFRSRKNSFNQSISGDNKDNNLGGSVISKTAFSTPVKQQNSRETKAVNNKLLGLTAASTAVGTSIFSNTIRRFNNERENNQILTNNNSNSNSNTANQYDSFSGYATSRKHSTSKYASASLPKKNTPYVFSAKGSRQNSLAEAIPITIPQNVSCDVSPQKNHYKHMDTTPLQLLHSSKSPFIKARGAGSQEYSSNNLDKPFKLNASPASTAGNSFKHSQEEDRMENDPTLYIAIKIFLTTEIKDEERKRVQASFDQFYEMFRRDASKFPYQMPSPMKERNTRIMPADQEDYLLQDSANRDILRRLWKKFYQLPVDFAAAYAKAVNEIILDKNLKSVILESIKQIQKRSGQTNQNSFNKPIKTITFQPQTTFNSSNSKPTAAIFYKKKRCWRSEAGKKQLQDLKDLDSHMNINPWNSEMTKRTQSKMPAFLKEIQDTVDRQLEEKLQERAKSANKKKTYVSSADNTETTENNNNKTNSNNGGQRNSSSQGDNAEQSNQNSVSVRSKRMKAFSVTYSKELEILAIGLINRQLQLYDVSEEKQGTTMSRIYWHQFTECVIEVCFRYNQVTHKWNIALLFENDQLRVYQIVIAPKNPPQFAKSVGLFQLFFSYSFEVEVDRMATFQHEALLLTSYKGHFYVFQDHLTSANHSQDCQAVTQYYLDQENKLTFNGTALSITAVASSDTYRLLIFGTSKGKIAFYEVKTKVIADISVAFLLEFLGIQDAGDGSIVSLHEFKKQNQLVSICSNHMVTIWDIARRVQIQSFRGSQDQQEIGNSRISASIFSQEMGQLLIAANSLKVWEMRVNKDLVFQEKKMQLLYDWRQKDIYKQDNYLLIESEKSSLHQQQLKGQHKFQTPTKLKRQFTGSMNVKGLSVIQIQQSPSIAGFQSSNKTSFQAISIKQVVLSKGMLILWDSTQKVTVVNMNDFKVKYSFMLSAGEDEKIEVIDILDNKIIALATSKGEIFFKNLYTEELCYKISDYNNFPLKITLLLFLPDDCQMTVAAATQEGNVLFFNSTLKKKSTQKCILFHAHKKRVLNLVSNNSNLLVSSGEDNVVNVFSLRSCSVLTKIECQNYTMGQLIQNLCFVKEKAVILANLDGGEILELKCSDGRVTSQIGINVGKYACMESGDFGKEILTVDEDFCVRLFRMSSDGKQNNQNNLGQLLLQRQYLSVDPLSMLPQQINLPNSSRKEISMVEERRISIKRNISNSNESQLSAWGSEPVYSFSLEGIACMDGIKDQNGVCLKIQYSYVHQHYYLFISLSSAVILNFNDMTMQFYNYSEETLSDCSPIPVEQSPVGSYQPSIGESQQ